ncbi:hypothetical protein JCM21714_2781 [Gracilibacillus boraciitolerans JCM 21714]|uniref:Zincin peptidase n=1 Tax=Gracilibacillus boraciitolerans JCM 21714 TaxID=1298598 RepID=W4VLH2_9BACI|nr:DUF3267 domain-containing protein [Gracilibacillus boraciitolerans]GAE93678.1 hypothetical protein JCM21714_2781 [Gracilibacillus boraciitolerans JCM 21714]
MNCWDSININKQLGHYRSIILSFLFGLLSFILLYLPFSLIHKEIMVKDHGLIPLTIGLAILPLMHKIIRIIPLKCLNKNIKLKWKWEKKIFPNFNLCEHSHTTKPVLLIALLLPTIVITIPCVIGSFFLAAYYPYFLLGGAINLSLSFIDFLYIRQLWKAPKKCVISNDEKGYDILISR